MALSCFCISLSVTLLVFLRPKWGRLFTQPKETVHITFYPSFFIVNRKVTIVNCSLFTLRMIVVLRRQTLDKYLESKMTKRYTRTTTQHPTVRQDKKKHTKHVFMMCVCFCERKRVPHENERKNCVYTNFEGKPISKSIKT